ncbi:MAG: DNA polymerase III subunit epsilon [Alphaproteobacteria bacterium]|nr:DNA polymerase III subunit epsilon [Alphaproteobacteria bacterium]
MRELCLDIETTGLDPRSGHRIIEVAAVELVNKVKTGNFFHSYINPRREVPQEAYDIHGISTEFLQDKPIFEHVAHKFLDFIAGATLVIHNAAFDTKFLNYELQILGLSRLAMERVIDSLTIARSKFPGAQASLDALCKRFGIDSTKRTKHGALLDSELLCEVYIELMGGAQKGFGFDASRKESKKSVVISESITSLPKREFPVSVVDLELHKEFMLKHFKKNLWGY